MINKKLLNGWTNPRASVKPNAMHLINDKKVLVQLFILDSSFNNFNAVIP